MRYTYVSKGDVLAQKILNSIEEYGKIGYNKVEVKNYWLNPKIAYNGINTILSSPNGQKFELQYHTQQSFDIKNGKLHALYEEFRLYKDENCSEALWLKEE